MISLGGLAVSLATFALSLGGLALTALTLVLARAGGTDASRNLLGFCAAPRKRTSK